MSREIEPKGSKTLEAALRGRFDAEFVAQDAGGFRRGTGPAGGDQVAVDRDTGVGVEFRVPVAAGLLHFVFDPVGQFPTVGHPIALVNDAFLPFVRKAGDVLAVDDPALAVAPGKS